MVRFKRLNLCSWSSCDLFHLRWNGVGYYAFNCYWWNINRFTIFITHIIPTDVCYTVFLIQYFQGSLLNPACIIFLFVADIACILDLDILPGLTACCTPFHPHQPTVFAPFVFSFSNTAAYPSISTSSHFLSIALSHCHSLGIDASADWLLLQGCGTFTVLAQRCGTSLSVWHRGIDASLLVRSVPELCVRIDSNIDGKQFHYIHVGTVLWREMYRVTFCTTTVVWLLSLV